MKHKIKRSILKRLLPNGYYIDQKGYCPCCEKNVSFCAFSSWLRDHFVCSNCFCIPRERAIMTVIEQYYPNWKQLSIHESSPGKRGASLKLKKYCSQYLPTQYFQNKEFGTMIDSFKNENLENQSFDDETFDLVITQDVMEHIYNPENAFKEIERTLRPGGAHIFTVPIINHFKSTERWAVKGPHGNPIFLKEPEYHGNPVDSKGSPVTMHWGYDIIDFIESSCGMKTIIEYLDNLHLGIGGQFQDVFVSKKGIK